MSQQLISHSPDLKRLRDEGYEIEVRGGYLLLHNIPYVNHRRELCFGTLVSDLTIAGGKAGPPKNHVSMFSGNHPCNKDGSVISQIAHGSNTQQLAEGLVINHSFSNKPKGGYSNYYDKMVRYCEIISGPAQSLNPDATARTFKVIESPDEESVFHYYDTNSSRADIQVITSKLKGQKIGIIGVGGTGSYVLDLVAKTPVAEIHLFDGDKFLQHNAFRAPGAPTVGKLNRTPKKATYFRKLYSNMHKHIYAHAEDLTPENIHKIKGFNFVFLCIDQGVIKRLIVETLEELNIPFIDVGMGIEVVDSSLIGILRVTTSTPQMRGHVREKGRIAFAADDENDVYSQNIQIADLNCLNAALAVIKWKKLAGFYQDMEKEHFSTYSINVNSLLSDDLTT